MDYQTAAAHIKTLVDQLGEQALVPTITTGMKEALRVKINALNIALYALAMVDGDKPPETTDVH